MSVTDDVVILGQDYKQLVLEVYTINDIFTGFKPRPRTRHFSEVLPGGE